TIQLLARNNESLRTQFLNNATSYFPVLGHNLAESINTPSKSGVALVIALLITFYGARGVALAIQHAQNHIWAVPRVKRAGFPKSLFKGFFLIFWGGVGFLTAASLTGYAAGAQHFWLFRLLLGLAGFVVLFVVFWGIFTFGSSARKHPFASIPGAVFAATGLLVLQAIGGYLIAHQLRSQTGLNAQFAVVLALLFWLYLQAQVFLYAVELNTVRVHRLWPRAINPKPPLPADEKAYELYHQREAFVDKR
ncbi:YihY/virulence factor BrkB family protein, partial [Candidatus Saccharibacteria bacterium]|nr:YihY/virulence factor BrkB family protein [Candidatus Saccharibacteria bacterium]